MLALIFSFNETFFEKEAFHSKERYIIKNVTPDR